jgi:hypothetical protein
MYETFGLPLEVLLTSLWDRNMIPDWLSFYDDARKAGMKHEKVCIMVETVTGDVYGPRVREEVMVRLRLLRR